MERRGGDWKNSKFARVEGERELMESRGMESNGMEKHGEAWRSMEKHGEAWTSMDEHGGACFGGRVGLVV